MPYQWIPNTLPDTQAIERLRKQFPKPTKLARHPWFMSEIQDYFTEFVDSPVSELDFKTVECFVQDAGHGIKSFGRFDEWVEWFHYLLPDLIFRAPERYLLGDIITYFINLYPQQIDESYAGFREDILNTLGKTLMLPDYWHGNDLSDMVLQAEQYARFYYGNVDFLLSLSPMLLFCLKYLTPPEIETWVASMVAIPGIHWHFHLLLWLNEATIWLETFGNKSDVDIVKSLEFFGLDWNSADNIVNFERETDFIAQVNMDAFKEALKNNRVFYV